MSTKRFVYGLTDPDGSIRYVGFSMSGMRCPKRHSTPTNLSHDTPKTRWLRPLLASGAMYGIAILQVVATKEEGYAAEREWIAKLRTMGARLTNSTDGGDGARNPSSEARAKLRRANLGVKRPPRSPEWSARLSASLTGRKVPRDQVERHADALRGRPLSTEHRAALRAAKEKSRADGKLALTPEMRAQRADIARQQVSRERIAVVDTFTGITYRSMRSAARLLGIGRSDIVWKSGRFTFGKVSPC